MEGEQQKKEVVLQGLGVSPGVAVSPAYLVITEDERYVERDIEDDEIAREIARFEDALISTRHQIHEIQTRISDAIGQENASIFDAHLLVVDDRSFVEEVIKELELKRKNVETVLHLVANRYADALARVEDDYLRERAADVKDVARRILRNLAGRKVSSLADLTGNHIVIANDLSPSDTAMMRNETVVGFATDLGSRTSHTAIMARALEIPAIVGLHDVSVRVLPGDTLLLDGNKGLLVINPSEERLIYYGAVAETQKTIKNELQRLRDLESETTDGYKMTLAANIEEPEDVDAVIQHGALGGVGLFRSEFLYLSRDALPDEAEQEKAYSTVASRLYPAPVVIRTIDLGGDKFLSQLKMPQEMNPFMGWRAIRYCLANPAIFMTQLRAILRASRYTNVKIMYPMVSDAGEVIQANEILEQAKDQLRNEGVPFNEHIDIGVMVEIPSASLTAELIAPHVSFFSIGTNDLVQYTLAVDRVNEQIAYLYRPTHQAIIKLIRRTIEVGHQHGLSVSVCGEMAGNILMAPLLMGLGADSLSVSPSMAPMVKQAIRNMSFSQAEELGNVALNSESPEDVLYACRELVKSVAPNLLQLVE
ncbi:MAG: phosphoenolpyruvate--protein phosphotransferase [Kiritimatiellae bacterium]|nr:phosphoenolpyruvate--protein phosphotransferase [Kiritimatiellia bacterium]